MKVYRVTYSAIHEAAHVYAAIACGGGPVIVYRSASRYKERNIPGVSFLPRRMEPTGVVFVLLAGMAAERRARREFEDPAPLEDLIAAGRNDLDFFTSLRMKVIDVERALDIVEDLLAEDWQDILRLAVYIQRAWDVGEEEVEVGEDDLQEILARRSAA